MFLLPFTEKHGTPIAYSFFPVFKNLCYMIACQDKNLIKIMYSNMADPLKKQNKRWNGID